MNRLLRCFPVLALTALVAGACLNPEREAVEAANRLYAQEQYEDAAQGYIEAAGLYDPESSELRLNLGNSLYSAGDYIQAASEYIKVPGAGKPEVDAGGLYGLGNAKFQQEDYAGAIQAYESALLHTPDDEDVKHNLKVARIRLKEQLDQMKDQSQPEQQQQQQEGQEGEQQESEGQQQQDGEKQEDQEQDQQGESQQDEGQEAEATPTPATVAAADPNQDEQDSSQQQEEEREEGQMSPEEVNRYLDAMERDERQRRDEQQRTRSRKTTVERDW